MSLDQLSEEEIFEQAFALQSPQARQEFLQRVCQDEQQRARIHALLREGAPEASFLEKGPAVLQESNSRPSEIPTRIGDFEILAELGRGGMGVVYRARQCSLNRLVALKLLSTGLGLTAKAIMRFKLEAEAAAKLHHTNIVPIYWTGEENRVPYYAMELIDGPSLDQVIKQLRHEADCLMDSKSDGVKKPAIPEWIKETLIYSSRSASDAAAGTNSSGFDSASSLNSDSKYYDNLAKMIAGVADALAHSHNHGIVHRDVKPANLLLSSDGRLSINDFGLARMLEEPGMTMTGELMGSPMYMSPEQITAGRLPLDHRTDIYSLGATLYELLTLQPPFAGRQRDQVLSQVIHKDPPKPRSINPRVPRDLETICIKAMEKDPDKRYQQAERLAEDLRRFVNRHAISARRVGPLEKGVRWVRKNKAISASVCAILIVTLGVGAFEFWRGRKEARDQAILAAQKAVFNVDPDQAQTHLKRAMELGMDPDEAELLMSQVHLMEGKTEPAIAILKRLQNRPDSRLSPVTTASLLAEAYAGSGRWGEYVKTVDHLLTCQPATDEERFRLGGALIFVAPDRALELIETASRQRFGYAEAWMTRASANVFLSLAEPGGNLDRIKEAEFCLQTARKIFGNEESASYVWMRLYCRLTAAHLHRMKGGPDDPTATEYLKLAEKDVAILAKKPNYYGANLMRMYYYDLTDNFEGMNVVMDDIIQSQHRGWLTDPFWAACVRRKEYDLARQKLRALPQDDEYVIGAIARFRLLQAASREEIDRIYQEESEKLPAASHVKALLLFGKRDEAKKHYQWVMDNTEQPKNSVAFAVCLYMTDVISDRELLDRAKLSEPDLAVANYIIGMKKLSEGKRNEALRYFQGASSGTMYHWTVYILSRTWAERLDPHSPYYDEGWPHWVPPEPADSDDKVKEKPD